MITLSMFPYAVALLLAVPAQPVFKPSPNPVTEAVRQSLEQHSKHLVARGQLMPADKYRRPPDRAADDLRPAGRPHRPEQHAICSGIGAVPADDVWKLAASEPKDVLVAALTRSFVLCADALGKVTDAALGEEVSIMGKRPACRVRWR